MALFQVNIELIPAEWAEENDYSVENLYDDDGYDTSSAWEKFQLIKDLNFDDILPKGKSWDKDLQVWGNDKKHDINVWYENGNVTSIGFRLDLREDINSLINKLVNVAEEFNCVLFVPGQEIIVKPNMFELKKYILKSDAAKFVKDPVSYFK
jgi:hypothetical protein